MRILILILAILWTTCLRAQNWNPFISTVYIIDSPLDLNKGEFAELKFNIGNSGTQPLDRLEYPLRAVVSLMGVVPRNIDDLSESIIGADFFNVMYLQEVNTLIFTQKDIIPPILNGGVNKITLHVRIVSMSSVQSPRNGFQINLVPPGYTNLYNHLGDDAADIMTYTVNSLLPVEMVEFLAEMNGCDVNVSWKTASELNNKEFILERSVNNKDWMKLATIPGNGNSVVPISYQYLDTDAQGEKLVYYRLTQVDDDGTATVSKMISVNIVDCNNSTLTFFPNPASDVLFVKNTSNKNVAQMLEFFSASGQLVKTISLDQKLSAINVSDLIPGSYIIRMRDNDRVEEYLHRFVIQR